MCFEQSKTENLKKSMQNTYEKHFISSWIRANSNVPMLVQNTTAMPRPCALGELMPESALYIVA